MTTTRPCKKPRPAVRPLIRETAGGWERLVLGTAKAPQYEAYAWDNAAWEARQGRAEEKRSTMQSYYQNGGITIYHGDCRAILPQLPERAALLWTDSAYEIESGGNTTKRMMGGIFDPKVYDNGGELFATVPWVEWVPLAYAALREDADAVLMSNDKNLGACLNAMEAVGLGLHNVLIWRKQNKTPNRWGMKNIEFMAYGWKGRARILNDCGMPQEFSDRNPTGKKRHKTEKPVSLIHAHITNMTAPGALVLDPFMGCGSTLVAAKRSGRRAVGIELDEKTCEDAARWLETIAADERYEPIVMELAS